MNDKIVYVSEICARMGEAAGKIGIDGKPQPVSRQAVYSKAERKKFPKRYVLPITGKGKKVRAFTEDEAKILVEEDLRFKGSNSASGHNG